MQERITQSRRVKYLAGNQIRAGVQNHGVGPKKLSGRRPKKMSIHDEQTHNFHKSFNYFTGLAHHYTRCLKQIHCSYVLPIYDELFCILSKV